MRSFKDHNGRIVMMMLLMVLIAMMNVSAASYNGFEVKEGFGGADVIVIELHNVYVTKQPQDFSFEVPLVFYKAMEKELVDFDKSISLSDEELRNIDLVDLKKLYKNMDNILSLKNYFEDEDLQTILNWADEVEDSKTEYGQICKGMFEQFFTIELSSVLSSMDQFLKMIINKGYSSKELAGQLHKDEYYKLRFLHVMEAFPSVKFSILELK